MAAAQVSLPLPVLPSGWEGEKDFKAAGSLSTPVQRNVEPVGPHFLAHARRVGLSRYRCLHTATDKTFKLRHRRTFSEDDRIEAQNKAKNVENESDEDISEPEDPMMLSRDAKDWKVGLTSP